MTPRALTTIVGICFCGGIARAGGTTPVTIVLTGESVGYLEPCGCTTGQLGGIARRHTYIRNLRVRHEHVLLLDLGDLSAGFGRQEQLKAETFVNAMNEMGYGAAAVGERDVFLALARLTHLQGQVAKFPMLCANLYRRKKDGSSEPLLPATTIESAGDNGPQILLVGLLSKEADELVQAIEPSLRVTDPVNALREAVGHVQHTPLLATVSRPWPDRRGRETTPERVEQVRHGLPTVTGARPDSRAQRNHAMAIPGTADLIGVLAHMPQAEAVALARAVPSVDFVLCGGDHVKPCPPRQIGKTWVVTCGAQEKYMVEISFAWSRRAGALRPRIAAVALDERYPDSPDMLALLDGYQALLRREQTMAKGPRNVLGNGLRYVGSQPCAECHKEHFGRWLGHRHAAAYQTLRRRKRHHDPECVDCHVVGLSYASGFRDAQRTPSLVGVGCESCHGPGNLHCEQTKCEARARASAARSPRSLRLGAGGNAHSPRAYGKTDESTCTDCHDSAHDHKQRYKLFKSKPHCGFEGAVELLMRLRKRY